MTRPPISAARRAMIAKIHVAKKELRLDDDTYRALLVRLTGATSSRDCTDPQLVHVLKGLRAAGWDGPPEGTGKRRSGKPWVRKVWAIWGDLKPLIGATDDVPLRTFVSRQTHTPKNPAGISDPEFLSPAEATKVIHGLEGWLDRVRLKGVSHGTAA